MNEGDAGRPDAARIPALRHGAWRVRIDTVPGFLEEIARIRAALDVPVQAVRADRVLSGDHLLMAATHAQRAVAGGRTRAQDPAVEFLLYAAAERQIHRAVTALGVVGGEQEVVLVALGDCPADRFMGVVEASPCTVALRPWSAHGPDDPSGEAARAWWAARVGVAPAEPLAAIEVRVFGLMALLALERS